jgi:hypothetical protein
VQVVRSCMCVFLHCLVGAVRCCLSSGPEVHTHEIVSAVGVRLYLGWG